MERNFENMLTDFCHFYKASPCTPEHNFQPKITSIIVTYCTYFVNTAVHALNNIIRKCFYLPYLLLYPELQQMAFYGAGEEVKGNNNNSCVVCAMKYAHCQSYHIYQACTSWRAKHLQIQDNTDSVLT